MKKIECQISDKKMAALDLICRENGFTYAEFNRRALDFFLDKNIKATKENIDLDEKINEFIKAKG